MRSQSSRATLTREEPTKIDKNVRVATPDVSADLTGALSATPDPSKLPLAVLFDDSQQCQLLHSVQAFLSHVGVELALEGIPRDLACAGTVGRIGVPRDAEIVVQRQQVVIGAGFSEAPLKPVARLWRGLQRRADVIVDTRRCTTLPGSAAACAGNSRDLLLVSQRVVERRLRHSLSDGQRAEHWARAREAAEIVYRAATSEKRTVLLVRPIGRGTGATQEFSDALERHARAQRLPAPRIMKAGLLAALLTGAGGDTRWLVASVVPIDELTGLVAEAIGDTGAWPLVSIGRAATFYDVPLRSVCPHDPTAMVLAIIDQLHRRGQSARASEMSEALVVTVAAVARMREELGGTLSMPTSAFLAGIRANWGRTHEPSRVALRAANVPRTTPVSSGRVFRGAPSVGRTAARPHGGSINA
jgi:hypothetical protein